MAEDGKKIILQGKWIEVIKETLSKTSPLLPSRYTSVELVYDDKVPSLWTISVHFGYKIKVIEEKDLREVLQAYEISNPDYLARFTLQVKNLEYFDDYMIVGNAILSMEDSMTMFNCSILNYYNGMSLSEIEPE